MDTQSYRHEIIIEAELQLRDEIVKRTALLVKYKRVRVVVDAFGRGVAGIVRTTTIIDTPIGIVVGAIAIVTSVAGGFGKIILLRLHQRVRVHSELLATAQSSLNTITKLYLIAVENKTISATKLETVFAEMENFRQLRAQIRNRGASDLKTGEMLKAIYQQGLNEDETRFLTHAMTHSGEVLEWQEERNYKIVDKHSTGGVGDKTSLLLTPALAACGVKVPMVSGRGLGHTQGTLDKLESIPGFRVTLNTQEMRKILDEVGCFIAGQTEYFVPADKRMYAIRDVTGTINNDGLITGSIISKKAAESLDALVLDVKFGKAAFKKDDKSARNIATQMVKAGNGLGMKTAALLTDMDAPIGNMIGHVLEVVEAIKGPHWDGPEDLQDLVERLGGRALFLCGKVEGVQEGSQLIREKMQNGAAVNKFCEMLKAQGVESDLADRLCRRGTDVLKLLTSSKKTTKVLCQDTGYIHDIDGLKCADVIRSLGGCRTKAGENINLKIGLELTKHIGDQANKGEPWVIVHHDEDQLPDHIVDALNQAVVVKLTPCRKISCRIIDVISA